MPQIATETIEPPAHDALNTMTTHVGDELVERWSPILRAADAGVDVLDGRPAARVDVAAQFQQLVLGRLILCGPPAWNGISWYCRRVRGASRK